MRMKAAILMMSLSFVSVGAQQTAPTAQAAPPTVPSCPELATALNRMVGSDRRATDWGNLTRYREANRSLSPVTASESRVVFMGDSITDAWPQPRFGDFFSNKAYVGR